MSFVYAMMAIGPNGEFGSATNKNGLPFHSKTDLRWFKEMTVGQRLVISQKTLDLIPNGLLGRDLYISTRDGIKSPHGGFLTLGNSNTDVYVVGGKRVFLKHAHEIDIVFLSIIGNCDAVDQGVNHFFDIDAFMLHGFDIRYCGQTRGQEINQDLNTLVVLVRRNKFPYLYNPPALIVDKVHQHFEPYLKLKIKNRVTIQPNSHGTIDISNPVFVPITQTGILSLRKSLAALGLYTSGITFKSGWKGKPSIIVTNQSPNLVELNAGEEIGEITFLNNRTF